MKFWFIYIVSCIGASACITGFVYYIYKLIDCTLIKKIRERRHWRENKIATDVEWLGKWGA